MRNSKVLRMINRNFNLLGIYPIKTISFLRGILCYINDYLKLKKQDSNNIFPFHFNPILDDKYSESGMAKGHYFHQDLLVARLIYNANPIKHFGLGRYGDPIDFNWHLKGFENMYSMLRSKGIFYFSVPIGNQRIEFNAHRVFSISYLLDLFNNKFKIKNFYYVDDNGDLHENINLNDELIRNNCYCHYGLGIFELIKL